MNSRNTTSPPAGYDADDDTAVGEHSVSSADDEECEESTITPIRTCRRPSPLMRVPSRSKRRRHEKPRSSIVHPDIDAGLTTHIAARRQQLLRHRKATASSEPPLSLYDLSHLLDDYFRQQQRTTYEQAPPAPVSDGDDPSAEQEVDFPKFSRRARISYSCERLFLEDALEFSSDARILVEASPLHQIVHTNAAFCSLTAKCNELSQNKQASTIQGVQGRCRTGMPTGSLERVVSAMFDDRAVTVYPVQDSDGSGAIRYYLVEYTAAVAAAVTTVATTKKRLATDITEPTQAVG